MHHKTFFKVTMSLRYYDVLEETLKRLDEWKTSPLVSKDEAIAYMRARVLMLMTHVATTPLIGTAYAYPGDIKGLEEWASDAT